MRENKSKLRNKISSQDALLPREMNLKIYHTHALAAELYFLENEALDGKI